MKVDYSIGEVAPYINWIYFFHAWGANGMPPTERQQLQAEAEQRLSRFADHYRTHGLFQLFDARGEDDDIVIQRDGRETVIPCLRLVSCSSFRIALPVW